MKWTGLPATGWGYSDEKPEAPDAVIPAALPLPTGRKALRGKPSPAAPPLLLELCGVEVKRGIGGAQALFAAPLEAARPDEPKAGILPVPPVVADAKHQPGVPNVGGLSAALPAFEAGAQSATLGDLWELLLVPKAGAFACPDAEAGVLAAAAWEPLVCPALPLESPVPKEKPVGTGLGGAVTGIPPV